MTLTDRPGAGGLSPVIDVFQLVAPTPETVWADAGWASETSQSSVMTPTNAARRMTCILAPLF
jgi:hypothetical protein